jgi:hypothetical protein
MCSISVLMRFERTLLERVACFELKKTAFLINVCCIISTDCFAVNPSFAPWSVLLSIACYVWIYCFFVSCDVTHHLVSFRITCVVTTQ